MEIGGGYGSYAPALHESAVHQQEMSAGAAHSGAQALVAPVLIAGRSTCHGSANRLRDLRQFRSKSTAEI